MSTFSVQRTKFRSLLLTSLCGLLGAVLLLAIAAFILSQRQFSAATAAYPWLRWADEQRTAADRFRFALSTAEEVAIGLAPAAAAGIDSIPLELSAEAKAADVRALIANLNQINSACAMIVGAFPACGESAVAERHGRLERGLAGIPLSADFWVQRQSVTLALRKLIAVSAQACGLTPYRTETAFLVRPVDGYGRNGVTAWKGMIPGQCHKFEFGKFRHLPKLFAYSRAADGAAVGMLREDSDYAAVWGDGEVAWGGGYGESVRACVSAARAGAVADESCGSLDTPVSFGAVRMTSSDGAAEGLWLLADPGLCRPSCAWGQSAGRLPLTSLRQHAVELASLLSLRQQHRAVYGTSQPYVNGIAVVDDNGPYRAGVRVSAAVSHTPFGVESPFRAGDVITWLAGTPIFSDEDLRLALARFVTGVGADKTYRYQFWRYDASRGRAVKFEQSATVFFDPEYWLANGYSDSEVRALLHGLFNGLSFGWYRSISCGFQRVFRVVPSFTACRIAAANEWMLMRQLYPDHYYWGGVPAMIFSPVRFVLGAAGIAVSAGAVLVIELLEAGMTAVSELAPGEELEVTARQFAQSVFIGRLAHFGTALTQSTRVPLSTRVVASEL